MKGDETRTRRTARSKAPFGREAAGLHNIATMILVRNNTFAKIKEWKRRVSDRTLDVDAQAIIHVENSQYAQPRGGGGETHCWADRAAAPSTRLKRN